ncbi:MAG: bifunctional hydroxymethylpyrimidine kinase/phosphomethylpyrimidine kinase [bacterium]
MIPCALTIAGTDPTAGAGVLADIKTFAALGVYGVCVVTCITAQNASAFHGVHPVPHRFVRAQLDAVLEDFRVDAFKVGMVYQPETIQEIARLIHKGGLRNLVLDPVVSASSGGALLCEGGIDALRRELLPLAAVVTPNLHEAALLSGRNVRDCDDMREAARRIHGMGPRFVLIKGGHLKGGIHDLLYDGNTFLDTPLARIPGEVRGTGCTLSAAITAGLARGLPVAEAVCSAQEYTRRVIRDSIPGQHGPRYPSHFPLP